MYSKAAADILIAGYVAKKRGTDKSFKALRRIMRHIYELRMAAAQIELYDAGALEFAVTNHELIGVMTPYGLSEGARLREEVIDGGCGESSTNIEGGSSE